MAISNEPWKSAAENRGWTFDPAYNGYVRGDHHPNGPAGQFSSYPSDLTAEDACFVDGIETEDDALRASAIAPR